MTVASGRLILPDCLCQSLRPVAPAPSVQAVLLVSVCWQWSVVSGFHCFSGVRYSLRLRFLPSQAALSVLPLRRLFLRFSPAAFQRSSGVAVSSAKLFHVPLAVFPASPSAALWRLKPLCSRQPLIAWNLRFLCCPATCAVFQSHL